jgi:hypothetical protein
MTTNAVILKRAMKTLNLTGKALAKMISAHRDDGKVTAPETVSRWLNGVNPVDPAVIGWLNELLRTKALNLKAAVIEWPEHKSILIAVTNLKGGVGTTTVSQNLAVVSAYDYHLKTKHISVGKRGDTEAAVKVLERCGVRSEMMSFDMMLTYTPEANEIVIVDLAREAAYEALGNDPNAFLRNFAPDLFLVPADFGDLFEAQSTKKFTSIQGLRSRLRLLHRPRFMSVNFSEAARDAGFDVLSEEFCPQFIPQTIAISSHLPHRPNGDWQSREQQCHHIDLFNYLVEEAGGAIALPDDTASSILQMDINALLNYIDQWTK